MNRNSFGGRENSNVEYTSRGDRYEDISPEEYLKMIRPYLRDLINDQKPTKELNNEENDHDTERGEWKIQLVLQNNCTSTKNFKDTCTIYSASKPVEVFMCSNTNDVINRLFDTTLERFQQTIETSNDKGSKFIPESVALLYNHFQKIDIR